MLIGTRAALGAEDRAAQREGEERRLHDRVHAGAAALVAGVSINLAGADVAAAQGFWTLFAPQPVQRVQPAPRLEPERPERAALLDRNPVVDRPGEEREKQDDSGEIAIGDGVMGIAAAERRMIRVAGVGTEIRYGRTIRERFADREGRRDLAPEIPLPGLPDARAQLALPLLAGDRLVGVLGFESRDPLAFDEWDEAFLQIVANQIAMGIDRMQEDEEEAAPAVPARPALEAPAECDRKLRFVYFRNDETIFLGDEYLVRNVPAKIFWKILNQHQREGRTEFSNRELRMDPSLGLPGYKDNLESRLILLRKRLAEKCPWVRMVPVRRGRFALEIESAVELIERDSA